jgi:hypothetical protein
VSKVKKRKPFDRVAFAARLMKGGLPFEEAARRASVSEEKLGRALGIKKEGEPMNTSRVEQVAAGLRRLTEETGVTLDELQAAVQLARSVGSDDYEAKVKAKARELAAEQAADLTLEQEAIAELVNSGEVPLWEEARLPEPTERIRSLRETDRQRVLGEHDDFEQQVRRLMDDEGLDRDEAVATLANRGEVAF